MKNGKNDTSDILFIGYPNIIIVIVSHDGGYNMSNKKKEVNKL